MRRFSGLFLAAAASLLVHGVLGGGAFWLAKHARDVHDNAKAPTFAGDTFEIAHEGDDPSEPEVIPVETRDPDQGHEQGAVPKALSHPPRLAHVGASHAEPVEVPLTFGALGDRSAASVIISLSRGFPQAASTDAVWRTAPLGDAGSATMEVELNADGTLARWSLGPSASPALRQAMVRTMAFIGGRTFIARAAVTRLHVSARVTTDAIRDGEDAVYALHSEHDGETSASAYFSLTTGRRIELVVTR